MSYFVLLCFLQLLGLGFCQKITEGNPIHAIAHGANTAVSALVQSLSENIKNISFLDKTILSNCLLPPTECPNRNITFWYYSRSKPDNPVELTVSKPETFDSLEKNQNPWKIIIHGYTKSKDEIPNPQLRSAYLKHGDYNLISVNYEPLARESCYVPAVHNVPLIANCTAQIIDALIERNFFNSNNLHIIGFSMGGQVAGNIYSYMKHEKPSRVTGLDPAGPLFDGTINVRLNKDSGEFVDVIHTNALMKGKLEASGHIDFYVNGGVVQPGCAVNENESTSTCSHNRSPLYFAESINSEKGFWGIPCNSNLKFFTGLCDTNVTNLVQMGEFVPYTARGSYYLQTNDKEPFALGKISKVLSQT